MLRMLSVSLALMTFQPVERNTQLVTTEIDF